MIHISNAVRSTRYHELAADCLESAMRAAHPQTLVTEQVRCVESTLLIGHLTYDLEAYDRILVLGGGNGASALAAALEDVLGEQLDGGVVVSDAPAETHVVESLPGDHPIPSERGVLNTQRVLEVAESATSSDLVLVPITGGGSSLLTAPAAGLTLEDLQRTTASLLECGAPIHEINAVRKHCSAIKGGLLAKACAPATVVGLLISDVVGDDLATVASGPLVADPSTFEDALDVMRRYALDFPPRIRKHLERGSRGEIAETPPPDDQIFNHVFTWLLAGCKTAPDAALETASERGYATLLLSSYVRGEARETAKTHVAVCEEVRASGNPIEPPAVIASGGETTVTMRESGGSGGPNQEFALSAAIELEIGEVVVASVDTDGIDGSTDVAGAIIDADTVGELIDRRTAKDTLERNDVGPLLEEAGTTVHTGPTGTNVNDLRLLVIGDPPTTSS